MKKELTELLNNRVSLRRYQEKPISQEDMDYILHSAMRAPTAGNMMLYSIIKVEDEEKKKQLSKTCDNQPFIAKAPTLLIFCADFQRWYDYYEMSGVKEVLAERGETYRTATEGEFMVAVMDTLIASAYANVAAETIGIGSCYIGDIIENYEIHQELLNLPQWVAPVAMLTLGYYPENHKQPPKSRFGRENIVFDEKYERLSEEQLREMFREREEQFNPKNRFKAENAGQFNYLFKINSAFADEMTRSVKVMLEKWKG